MRAVSSLGFPASKPAADKGPSAVLPSSRDPRCTPKYASGLVRRLPCSWDLSGQPAQSCELTVVFVDDTTIRELNRRWRRIDRATDVLSFPLEQRGYLGDIAISLDTAARQARRYSKSLAAEIKRLVAHGLLHLIGYDHKKKRDAIIMRRMERQVLSLRGF